MTNYRDIYEQNEKRAFPQEPANEYGLLIDYEFCSDCHSCEVACKKHLGVEKGQFGIKVMEYGPVKNANDKWEWSYVPFPTDLCDLCEDRTKEGRLPTCVHHCQNNVMYWGPLNELAEMMAKKPKQVLFSR